MKSNIKRLSLCLSALMLLILASPLTVLAAEEEVAASAKFYGTFWSLVPPLVAIALALITKEVYSSLFVGILVGALFYSNFNFEGTILHIFEGGMISVLTDSYNMGILIFIDDYFNCLTVGSVMRPVTDKHNVSRAKLAYLIDATAAPVCIIAPISSWAAAVSGFVEGEDGITLFVHAIPYNFYALLTIFMMVAMVLMKVEFGPMGVHETNALKGDIYTTPARPYANAAEDEKSNPRGKVIDLLIPIISLVICCVIGMIYTGGFFSGTDFVTAFSQSDASVGLVLGSFFGLVITIVLYLIRRVMNFRDCMACIPDGFKAMVPAILILTFAWTLKAMTDSLGASVFVSAIVKSSAGGLMNFLPAIIFVIGAVIAFATGTSWGTFGILIPIVVNVFSGTNHELMIISISACMAGAVCGDHCSPISDTTIMASAGAQCEHVNHVSTQLPYAMVAAAVSFLTYIIAGFVQTAWIALPAGIILMAITLVIIRLKFDDLKM